MCSSLTDQVRSIAVVTTAVARGDLTQKIEIQVEGEMSTLKGNIFDFYYAKLGTYTVFTIRRHR